MKKLTFVLALALAASALTFAQGSSNSLATPQAQAQTITVEGKLALINGMIGVKSGTKTYYLPNIGRLAGFVDGVKEGASIRAEGYEYPIAAAPEYSMVRVTKLTAGGKDYDLSQTMGMGRGMGFGGKGDFGQGCAGDQDGRGMKGGRR